MIVRARPQVTALLSLAVMVGACSNTPSAGETLSSQLEALDDPAAFSMSYRAGGTDVLDCALPNRQFRIDVESERGDFVAHDLPSGDRIAERSGSSLRVHRSLFATGLTSAAWITVDIDQLPQAHASALRRALGPDLTGYLLAADPPPSGLAVAVAVLPIARSTTLIDQQATTSTYQLELDPDAYAEAASHPGDDRAAVSPTIQFTVDDLGVRQLVVTPADVAQDPASGWTIVFTPLNPDADGDPAPGREVDITDLDPDDLRPRPITGCALGDEPPNATP